MTRRPAPSSGRVPGTRTSGLPALRVDFNGWRKDIIDFKSLFSFSQSSAACADNAPDVRPNKSASGADENAGLIARTCPPGFCLIDFSFIYRRGRPLRNQYALPDADDEWCLRSSGSFKDSTTKLLELCWMILPGWRCAYQAYIR